MKQQPLDCLTVDTVLPVDVRASNPDQYTNSTGIGFKDGGTCNFILGISSGDVTMVDSLSLDQWSSEQIHRRRHEELPKRVFGNPNPWHDPTYPDESPHTGR